MKREVIQDFLNLPGIVGFALMDGRSRPYFCGIDRVLNTQQRVALSQGIQQVIATTPASFEFSEFQFSDHQVYIYKLDHGVILLVLANSELAYSAYTQTLERLKTELKQDGLNVIATFRIVAGATTLSAPTHWNQQHFSSDSSVASSSVAASTLSNLSTVDSPNGTKNHPAFAAELEEILSAINHLSQFTTHYLGVKVVVNYWKATRPAVDWLHNFQVERSAQISFTDRRSFTVPALTAEQHCWIQAWVAAFVERCTKVIRHFPKIVRQTALDDRQKTLLFPEASDPIERHDPKA
jgi:hypothetical protein